MCWVLDGSLRRACVREHARARPISACVCACAHVCGCFHSGALARTCACVYACLCERMCGFVRFHRIAIPRVCVASPCVRPLIARRWLAVFIARPLPRIGGRARGCVRCDRPVVARVRPQVSRGRAARPARDGLRDLGDLGTRPWSTPPAPSTSSAAGATTAEPSTTTFGRAPTEVRGPGGGVGVGGYT